MIANPKWQGVVTGSEDGMVYIYDLQRRNIQQKLQYDNNGTILAVASHPSIELLATGCTDNTVRFWAPKKKL
jgi:COMPASS component SWD3